MKALGVHTYFGGFQLGLDSFPEIEIVGSMESWDDGIEARQRAGLPGTMSLKETVPQAEFVFSNPPCSRFSSSATHHFSEDQKSDIENFCELTDTVQVTMASGARAMHWETGPLAWTKGREMVRTIHNAFKDHWGQCTTMLVKYDPRYGGIPQRRPRTHIIHFKGDIVPPAELPYPQWGPVMSVGDWMKTQLEDYELKPFKHVFDRGDAVYVTEWTKVTSSFMGTMPRCQDEDDDYALTVLTQRLFAWKNQNRWWAPEEYAALMTYPISMSQLYDDPYKTIMFLSKSVMPTAAQFMYTNIVEPMMNDIRVDDKVDDDIGQWGDNLWEANLTVKDKPRRTHDA